MYKFAEKITDKYLTKIIGEITLNVFDNNFEEIFKYFCETGTFNNSTIGATCAKLQKMAIEEVNKVFDKQIDKINYEVWEIKDNNRENIFSTLLSLVWNEFIDYTFINEIVGSFIDDQCGQKQEELEAQGILDFNGDYINKQ
jgi:hypothetical protein